MAQVINLGGVQPVDEGEALVVQHLANALPSNYLLYPNIELTEPGRQPYEYDVIVVTPHAVYVVEIKRWLGQISGGDYTWTLASGKEKANPLRLANQKARVLKSRLVQFSSSLNSVWVEACVAIADTRTRLRLHGAAAERAFLYTDVVTFLQVPSRLNTRRPLVPNALMSSRNTIRDGIEQEARIRTQAPHQIGHYTVVETLARTDLTDEYIVQNNLLPNSPKLRMRMYTFSPYVSLDQRAQQLLRIRRDVQALQSIGNHPNLVMINDFSTDDSGHFIELTQWSEHGTLRDLLERGEHLSLEEKVRIIIGVAKGLAAAHAKNVVHRDLRPENILLDTYYTSRLMNFEHARVEALGQATIWSPLAADADRRYLAPELDQLNPLVSSANDLYALGAIMYELLSGHVPFANLAERNQAGDSTPFLTAFPPDLPPQLVDLAATLYQVEPAARHYTCSEVVEFLEQLLHPPKVQETAVVAQQPPTYPLYYSVGYEIDGKFKVLAQLGSGGFGQVYKVFHDMTNRVCAMKIINGDYVLKHLQVEYGILSALNHPNIAKVYFADRIHSKQFYLLLEFIEGEPFTTYTKPENLLPPQRVALLIAQLLRALDYLHQPHREREAELLHKKETGELTQEEFEEFQQVSTHYLHRDIKPGNLMLDRHGDLKLIDFNIATRLSTLPQNTRAGTPLYMAPDIVTEGWNESSDLFAVGVVFYEMITGHHPFPNTPQLDSVPEHPLAYRPDLSDVFASFLYKAIQPVRGQRFSSAQAMLAELIAVTDNLLRPKAITPFPSVGVKTPEARSDEAQLYEPDFELEDWERDKANYNPYVTRLLTLYSQARQSNAGTRGLDPIARVTYVPTWLDDRLLLDILAGKHRLVIITGNAGDGKTAFIQQLESEAERRGSILQARESSNGKRFSVAGLDFETNYDGSQDEGGKANNQVLDEFFTPFTGSDPFANKETAARIIAINEGRLRDFLHAYRQRYSYLHKAVLDFLDFSEVEKALDPGLLLVNLNWRSVVAGNEKSIISRQVKKLVDPHFWVACQTCEYKERCFLKANADRFADVNGGEQVVERLRSLFEVVYLRRRLHITMRDTRSALSYILLRDHNCEDVARLLKEDISPADYLRNFYYNSIAASDEPASELEKVSGNATELAGTADRLVGLLMQVDPAHVANPDDDRALYFATSSQLVSSPLLGFGNNEYERELLSRIHAELQNEEDDPIRRHEPEVLKRRLFYHAMLRRKSFFERRDANWRAMLPYQYIQEFLKFTDVDKQRADGQELKSKIVFAISRAAGMRERSYAEKNVVLRASSTAKTSLKSFRLFPLEAFNLRTPTLGTLANYIEYTPDRLIFQHENKSVSLAISLDLFELLNQISDGLVPSPADIQGYFLNLSLFKNALAHLPYRDALLTENDREFYQIGVDDQNILYMRAVEKRNN
ncbi:methylation-associated defense system protein kinase MAD6 [Ktedonobacter robiniae]|uniref:Protein kinase n=1 Tax=Ktedonobacter robiniae TaxID=2778365 RepID=A0ABQ3UTB7_9CHLR|nr:protein kinase [Ktedonobacter robiniae]GHO56031.1 protein kinase [Ktedonobacter robiniae]